jgi:hypothetical protein
MQVGYTQTPATTALYQALVWNRPQFTDQRSRAKKFADETTARVHAQLLLDEGKAASAEPRVNGLTGERFWVVGYFTMSGDMWVAA